MKKKPNYEDQPEKLRKPVLVKTLRGFQFADGDQVYKGDILVRQVSYLSFEIAYFINLQTYISLLCL